MPYQAPQGCIRHGGAPRVYAGRDVGHRRFRISRPQGRSKGTQTWGKKGGSGVGGGGGASEAEGAPGVVEAIWVREADVAAGGRRLRVAALHVEDGLGKAGFGSDGEPAHAAGGAGEGQGVYADGAEG